MVTGNPSSGISRLTRVDAELGSRYLDEVGASLLGRCAMDVSAPRMARHAFSRPLFVPADDASRLDADLRAFATAVRAVPEILGLNEWSALAEHLGVPKELRGLCRGQHVSPPCWYGRADVIFDGQDWRLLELGLSPAVGLPEWGRSLPQEMLRDPAYAAFVRSHGLAPAGDPADGLRDIVRTAGGSVQHVIVADAVGAFADFGEELQTIADEVARVAGVTTEVLEVDQLSDPLASVAWLRVFTLSDFLFDPGMYDHWERLVGDRTDYHDPFVTPLAAELYNCKGMLAAARSEPVLAALPPKVARSVRRLLPETWMIDDLSESRLIADQDQLILKRVIGAGGDGSTAGWAVGSTEWRQAVARALGDGSYIVQRRVEPAPLTTSGLGKPQDWRVVWGVHYAESGLTGLSARVSPADDKRVGPNRGARPAPGVVVAADA